MGQIKYLKLYYFLVIFIEKFPLKTVAIIDDLTDTLHITAHTTDYLFGTNLTQSEIEVPFLKNKQRKVIARINLIDQHIDKIVKKVR